MHKEDEIFALELMDKNAMLYFPENASKMHSKIFLIFIIVYVLMN